MHKCLSDPLHIWLNKSFRELDLSLDKHITIVTILGKQAKGIGKSDVINQMYGHDIFQKRVGEVNSPIDAYLDKQNRILFLLFNGYGDVEALDAVFDEDFSPEMGFFERIAQLECAYIRSLVFFLITSHIIVFIQPSCTFDLSVCRFLTKANDLRLSSREKICSEMADFHGFPNKWKVEGRLAKPRLLFAYFHHFFRPDLNLAKIKEIIENLKLALMDQAQALLSHFNITESNTGGYISCSYATGKLPSMYIFPFSEFPRDDTQAILKLILNSEKKENVDPFEKNVSGFYDFIIRHVKDINLHANDRYSSVFYEFPTMEWLLPGLKLVHTLIFKNIVISEKAIAGVSGNELQFANRLDEKALVTAITIYRESASTSSSVYSKKEHDLKMKFALKKLESTYQGLNLKKMKNKLKQNCEAIWQEKRACEAISLTGKECTLAFHYSPTDLNVSIGRRSEHSSGTKYFSSCNCGLTQRYRKDPFTIKEANYDFYSNFPCCSGFESYSFKLFDSSSLPEKIISSSTENLQRKVESSNNDFGLFIEHSTPDEIDVLPDRDNVVKFDASSDRSRNIEGANKSGSFLDFFLDYRNEPVVPGTEEINFSTKTSDELTETTNEVLSESDLDSNSVDGEHEKSEIKEEQTDSDTENNVSREKLEQKERLANKRIFNDSQFFDQGEAENDSNESSTFDHYKGSYLDDEDGDLISYEVDWQQSDDFFDLSANHAELCRKLKEKYKGQFLDCVPNTESPSKLPLFPSWSLLCLGSSSLYSHKFGLREMPNFTIGTHYLLPVDVNVSVNLEKWNSELKKMKSPNFCYSSPTKKDSYIRVKLFIGFEYECARGHRFIIDDKLKPTRTNNNKCCDADFLSKEIPIWMRCTCKRPPPMYACLMRLHVVTPKIPVTVTLNPRVKPGSGSVIFHTGEKSLKLDCRKYYVLRFPFIYAGANGIPHLRSSNSEQCGELLGNCIQLCHMPSE